MTPWATTTQPGAVAVAVAVVVVVVVVVALRTIADPQHDHHYFVTFIVDGVVEYSLDT